MAEDVPGRLAAVRDRVAGAARRAGRSASEVRLVVVTKGVALPVVQASLDAGATELGESRAQELLAKASQLRAPSGAAKPSVTRPGSGQGPRPLEEDGGGAPSGAAKPPVIRPGSGQGPRPLEEDGGGAPSGAAKPPITWHFIGRLQRNKVAALAPVVDLWQSVDRIELGWAIAGRAPGAAVLVEVNVADDPAKAGVSPAGARSLVDGLRAAGLSVHGLMTIPAAGRDPRQAFAALTELAGHLELKEISMGMSDDFEVAIEEGATIVRVGRAIFGRAPEAHPPGGIGAGQRGGQRVQGPL